MDTEADTYLAINKKKSVVSNYLFQKDFFFENNFFQIF